MSVIEVKGLTKKYGFGRVRGITDMDFSVEEGELFGFIGPNGAGKSTTIRILMNFIRADSGTAKIDGLDCRLRSRDIKRFTGYMPSEVHFYGTSAVGELLDYACRLRGEKRGIWKELAAYYELDPKKRFRELSMGNRRKLSIIQAMMFSPRLLILDEPTGGLDPVMQDKFFKALADARKSGVTVFFSSHNLNEVQRYCSRVALVKDGRLKMMPAHEELPMHAVELVTSSDCGMLLDAVKATGIRTDGGRLRFMVSGSELASLLRLLGGMDVQDVVISKPSLEQVFHDIYSGEGKDNDTV